MFCLCSLTLRNECLNGADRLCLLFGSQDGRGRVALLRTVVAKLGVVAACNFYHVFGVVQFVFDALAERAVNGERVGDRIIAVEIRTEQDEAVDFIWMVGGNCEAIAPPMECPAMYQCSNSGNCAMTSCAASVSKIAM